MRILDRLDASLDLPEHEAMVLEQVRQLAVEKIAPRAAGHDEAGTYPADNIADMNALGMNAMFVPEALGGLGLSYAVYLACVREISKACASTGIIWATTFHGMKPVMDFGSDDLKARVMGQVAEGAIGALCITEPTAGSDATGMKTRFRADGNEIVIDGGKTFISNGDIADFLLIFGKWDGIDDDKKAISALVLEKGTPGFEALTKERKMGHRAAPTCGLAFDGCRVPMTNLLGEPGDGLGILLTSLNKSRPSVAAHALGIARGAFEDAVAYINERRQSGRRIVEFQGIQFMLADLATDLALTEEWLWRVARMVDGGATDFGVEASMLKMRASDIAMKIATEAVQLHGGYGYIQDFRAERLMRDAKITQIWEGTNQIHRQFIGRHFMER
ncbi:MAG: acyl-CoA dehydrogenase family protein [Alphaproteobacteria bacterium]|jgi:alkylation response protein AidB-like acyl-CoA dehydrogenase|nr:acyl-CoA dehydrogenase family protein [Alphaproteobacteria bacterium]